MGTQLPLAQRKGDPQFLTHICCGQMAAGINMPLGVEVGLVPRDLQLDGDPTTSQKRGRSPLKISAHVYCG